jgi:NADH dehydrogenase (ubiquinone) 1 alpha subcomplex subunit 1
LFSGGSTIIEAPNQPGWTILKKREREEKSGAEKRRVDQEKMGWRWVEAVLPLGIIAGMLCIAGNVQYAIHTKAHGRPKHIGNDMWDVAMERRDKNLLSSSSSS